MKFIKQLSVILAISMIAEVLERLIPLPVAASIYGLVLMLTQVTLPIWVLEPMEVVSSCNTALSLLVIGAVLGELDGKSLFNKDALGVCFVRLLLIPLVALAGCLALKTELLVTQVTVVLAAMPAALTTAMLAGQYGKDEGFAVSMVFLSTVASMVTVPLLCMLMMAI